jgi:hypothetical protein
MYLTLERTPSQTVFFEMCVGRCSLKILEFAAAYNRFS